MVYISKYHGSEMMNKATVGMIRSIFPDEAFMLKWQKYRGSTQLLIPRDPQRLGMLMSANKTLSPSPVTAFLPQGYTPGHGDCQYASASFVAHRLPLPEMRTYLLGAIKEPSCAAASSRRARRTFSCATMMYKS
ncbi:hypothetical protein AB1N83_007688 [Pleurotus pulmonarius]